MFLSSSWGKKLRCPISVVGDGGTLPRGKLCHVMTNTDPTAPAVQSSRGVRLAGISIHTFRKGVDERESLNLK